MRTWLETAFLFLVVLPGSAHAATYYVQPGADGDGTQSRPWGRIAKANAVARAGDNIILYGGDYRNDPIAPTRSGQDGKYITFRAAAGNQPILSDTRVAIELGGRSWIKVDGITADGRASFPDSNINTWLSMVDSHHNVIENSTFRRARGWSGVFLDGGSSFNILRNNRFEEVGTPDSGRNYNPANQDLGDLLDMRQANNNLIEDNDFSRSGHNLFEVRGHYNVIRRNVFENDWGGGIGNRIGELSGSTKGGVTGLRGFNLFEQNIVRGSRPASDNPNPPGIKIQGQGQIVRRNYFYDLVGTAVLSEVRDPPIDRVIRNRIFNNSFDRLQGLWKFVDYDSIGPSDGNIWKNNAIGRMSGRTAVLINLSKVNWVTDDAFNNNRLIGNIFASPEVFINASRGGSKQLRDTQQQFPRIFTENDQLSFQFSNGARQEDTSSPLVDAGVALTETMSAGSGTRVPVKDAGYFSDGFGLIRGDRIRIGSNSPVTVTTVNYNTHMLTLSEPVSWRGGETVNIDFIGNAPDVGADDLSRSGRSAKRVPKPPVAQD